MVRAVARSTESSVLNEVPVVVLVSDIAWA